MSRDKNGRFVPGAASERRRQWIGERFGHLLITDVEYGVQRGKKKRTVCTCVCDCGNEIRTVTEYLVAGKTSCGCDTVSKRTQSQRMDLTGQRFGKLVVKEMLWVHPHTKCRCLCDCGNETVVINTGLTSGKTQSCGCYQREMASKANTDDFTNQVTETGIVFLRRVKQNERGLWIWECECPSCHDTFQGIPAFIKAHNIMSCGCDAALSSKWERWIRALLDENSVKYKTQYSFDDCVYDSRLRFDFAILSENNEVKHLIEYDGVQHFKAIDFFGGESAFEKYKQRDKIKDEYCIANNIPLTRLPYTMSMGQIKEVIENIINP